MKHLISQYHFKQLLTISFFLCTIFFSPKITGQAIKINGATLYRFTSSNTCFPETNRLNGHIYDSVLYDYPAHYSDSTVLVLVPDNFSPTKNNIDIVFWFHGWRNNIDTALSYFHLATQFIAANRNAVLVLAESAKNSPDSYGGKLEQAGVFQALVQDLMQHLKQNKLIRNKMKPGHIILAGHSGAYRVIAYILQKGGQPVSQVILFDALYSETDKYLQWIKTDPAHQFIHLFTNHGGGTDEVSVKMMADLKTLQMPYLLAEEKEMNTDQLSGQQILFIHSLREHNEIIFNPDNFRFFLENSPALKKAR